jgi:hypothetical protein
MAFNAGRIEVAKPVLAVNFLPDMPARFRDRELVELKEKLGLTVLITKSTSVALATDGVAKAMFGDFVPTGAAVVLGRVGGGNSLDNTLRLRAVVPTRWVLCDIQMSAADRGFAQGHLRLFAEDGTLMATASQSLVLRLAK